MATKTPPLGAKTMQFNTNTFHFSFSTSRALAIQSENLDCENFCRCIFKFARNTHFPISHSDIFVAFVDVFLCNSWKYSLRRGVWRARERAAAHRSDEITEKLSILFIKCPRCIHLQPIGGAASGDTIRHCIGSRSPSIRAFITVVRLSGAHRFVMAAARPLSPSDTSMK